MLDGLHMMELPVATHEFIQNQGAQFMHILLVDLEYMLPEPGSQLFTMYSECISAIAIYFTILAVHHRTDKSFFSVKTRPPLTTQGEQGPGRLVR